MTYRNSLFMREESFLPEIKEISQEQEGEFDRPLYKEVVYKILRHVIPPDFFKQKEFDAEPPILKCICPNAPGKLIIQVFGKYQKHSLKFFIEMLSNWLVPGRRLNLSTVFSSAFCMPSVSSLAYMVCEVIINVSSQFDLDKIKINLPIIESEICLGMKSSFYAKRILEVKGLANIDTKTALIQDNIAYILERKPQYFDFDLLTEMQHILVICRDEFKSLRSSRHLSRIISILYLFRKSLSEKLHVPHKRHMLLKIFRSELKLQNEKKNILCFIIGFNFLREKEVFEKRHVMRSIQAYIPNAVMVENSFFEDRRSPQSFSTLYLEIEKSNGEKFNDEEIKTLRNALPSELVDGIEQLVHSVFMPRNEEEIMRNVLILSSEVKFLRDLPQVMITFDEQIESKLAFTVILVRILKPGGASIHQLFEQSNTMLEYIHDRCKTVGYLRGKHTKEATVFSVKVDKDEFMRRDHSIDLNKARQVIVFKLLEVIGEFRDYNGGMISKQNELLSDIKSLIAGEGKFNELLLENLFFSIEPIVMRTVLEPEVLKTVFLMLQESIAMVLDPNINFLVHAKEQPSYALAVIKSHHRFNREGVLRALAILHAKSPELITAYVQVHDIHYYVYIFRCADRARQELFTSIIQQTVPLRP